MGIRHNLVLLLAPLGSLLAQEAPREGIFGEVHDRDGKVWADASVTLLHVAHPALTDAQYVDRVTAKSDERGRFRAQLLPGARYAAWASGPVSEGTFRCSTIATDVVAGVPVLLREEELHWQRSIRPEPDASWERPLTFSASCRVGSFLLREPLLLADGLALLPPWPTASIGVQACEQEQQVFTAVVRTTLTSLRSSRSGGQAGAAPPDDEALHAELGRPHALPIAARTVHAVRLVGRDGKPVAAARVVAEGPEPRAYVGASDADGVVRVLRAGELKPPHLSLVHADGCAEGLIDDDEFVHTSAGAPKDKVLEAGTTVHGRLLLDGKQPAGGVALLLEASIAADATSTYFGVDTRLWHTNADGTFALPGRIRSHPYYLAAVLTSAQRARWSSSPKDPPVAALALITTPSPQQPKDLGDVRLDRLGALDLRVFGPDGGAPGPTTIVIIPIPPAEGQFSSLPHEPLNVRTDRMGRVRLLAVKDVELAVWAMTKAGAAWVLARADGQTRELKLDAAHVVSLRFTDAEQKPLADLSIDVVTPHDGDLPADAKRLLPLLHDAFMVHGFPSKLGRTDADGRVQLVMPLVGCGLDLAVRRGRESMRFSQPWPEAKPGEATAIVFAPNGR